MNKMRLFSLLLMMLGFIAMPVAAQDASARPEQFAAAATAVDGVRLLTNRYQLVLWGVEPIEAAGTTVGLQARTTLDNLIGGQPVRCEVKEWRGQNPVARCLNTQEKDLALAMIEAGYAVVDRPAVGGSVFDVQYQTAETRAQGASAGGWGMGRSSSAGLADYFGGNAGLARGWLLGVSLIPILGLLALGLYMTMRLSRLERYVRDVVGDAEARKQELREQERYVMASMIENELSANKGKLEAFIIIYNDLLKSLRQSKDHRYQVSGEIVHDAPVLERSVFESNMNRMELLGANVAGEIVGVYGHVQSNPNYTTLDASIPLDDAILKVQKVITEAEGLLPRIDKIIQSLHVTIRDKQARPVRR